MDKKIIIRKHKYMSCINIVSWILTALFESIILVVLIGALIVKSDFAFIQRVVLTGVFLFIIQCFIINLMNKIFSRYGYNKVLISKNHIETIEYNGPTNDIRIVYSPLTLYNFLVGQPGELIMISSHQRVFLGWYTSREIIKMMQLINIIIEN